ncbi:sigma-70 family RNA polymerase sigma factor [Chloroflexota bacterium]
MLQQPKLNPPDSRVKPDSLPTSLMDKAQTQGYLLADDLLELIPEAEDDIPQLEEIFIQLVQQDIPVYTTADEARAKTSPTDRSNGHHPVTGIDPFDLSAIPADDVLSLYLKEAAQVPLLTGDEEVALAKQIETGRQAEKKLKNGVLADTQALKQLKAQVKAGQEARSYLIRANTRLVISIAKKYRGQGVPFADLIQEGNLGLMTAVKKFDYHQGYKLSTYATWWIRQAVTRGLAGQSRTIRVPVHMSNRIRKIKHVAGQLEQDLGCKPGLEELAQAANLSPEKVRWALGVSRMPVSLEDHVSAENDNELGDFIKNRSTPSPPDVAALHLLHERLESDPQGSQNYPTALWPGRWTQLHPGRNW